LQFTHEIRDGRGEYRGVARVEQVIRKVLAAGMESCCRKTQERKTKRS
jgi:hypothetical protein